MKNKIIYVLRHGQTDYNKNGMVQGRGVDASLNETGISQTNLVYDALKDVPFDVIFTSSLKRTHETISPFIENGLGLNHISLGGLDEISWGDREGIKTNLEAKNHYVMIINGWRSGNLSLRAGGGETPMEVMKRQQAAFKQIINFPGNKILVCMHGRAMRVLFCWLLNYPLNYMDGFPHQNCAYYKLIYRDNDFFIDEFNQIGHLNS
ncbi:MAG: histidine phosphatase family protein [Ekhidna sp.]|nr:histidine phosphatase family protein [Ekhidna sp.]MBC6426986.1 histidine phosphatase family protein [Ekhidna sp.]